MKAPFRLNRTVAILLGLSGVALGACNDIEVIPTDTNNDANVGAVAGRVCASTGDAWLEGAYVYTNVLDDDGYVTAIRETYTDRDGYFVLDRVPVQTGATLYLQKGTWQSALTADVKKGALTQLPDPACRDPLSISAAVVLGEYDTFSKLLDRVGVTGYSTVDGVDGEAVSSFFANLDGLLGYDVLCVNGGIAQSAVLAEPLLLENLRAYVEAGGSLFVTDWSYDLVEQTFPTALDFFGDDTLTNAAELGVAQVISGAQVVDQSLASWLGKATVELRYDLAYWPLVEGAASQVVVHVTGDASYYDESLEVPFAGAPLLLSFSAGYGSVIFSTFRAESNLSDDTGRILEYMLYKL